MRAEEHAEQTARIHAELTRLTGPQIAAIELLLSGSPDRTVAEKVGVHSKTVMRWRLYHAAFRAELARRRQELWSGAADRFRLLLDRTLDVLTRQLNAENEYTAFRAARALLIMARCFRPPDESPDPERVLDLHARVIKRAWKSDDPMFEAIHEDERAEAGRDLYLKLHRGEEAEGSAPPRS
jgi:hypothetical protein